MAQLDKIRLSGVTYDIIDATAVHSLDGYWTTGETTAAITAATNALAESIAEQGYQTSGDVQNAISGKADTTAVTQSINEAVSGKLDTSVFETYSGATDTVLASKFAGATWNSTDKKIYFYDNASATGTALAYIDGTDFVKDGFLSSVTIDNKVISGESVPCLVFIWNTDAGIQETDIPLSGIFDPTNYVSVDTYTAYTASTEAILASKANTANTYTLVEIYDDTSQYNSVSLKTRIGSMGDNTTTIVKAGTGLEWSGTRQLDVDTDTIQAKLVSGTSIKTINNESVLGSGNITIEPGNKVEVSGTTLIFL